MGRKELLLPSSVVGPADVNRVLLEMEKLEDFMRQSTLTKVSVTPPKTSRTFDDLTELNQADLTLASDRTLLMGFLQTLQQHAPVVHISFAAEPSAAFTVKIVEWLRSNISPFILVHVGLQPSIAAGCVVRTTNKVFDLSLGRFLRSKRHLLTEALHTSGSDGASAAVSVSDAAA